MVDDDLGNLPHHGEIHQLRTMAAMAIFGWILQPHQPEPFKKVLDESGSTGFCEKLLIQRGVENVLHLSCQFVRSCHQQQMVVVMAIDDGFGGCYFTDHF